MIEPKYRPKVGSPHGGLNETAIVCSLISFTIGLGVETGEEVFVLDNVALVFSACPSIAIGAPRTMSKRSGVNTDFMVLILVITLLLTVITLEL